MKKRANSYPFYDNDNDIDYRFQPIDAPPFDNLLTTDRLDIDHLRGKMNDLLMECDQEGGRIEKYGLNGIPGFEWIIIALESKLKKAGFEDKYIKDARCLYDLIFAIKNEQWGQYTGRPPYGFPSNTYTVSDDKKQMWIHEGIEATLLALYAFRKLEELIGKEDKANYVAAKACIYSFLIVLDSARSGLLRKVALSGGRLKRENFNKRKKREKWKGLTRSEREKRNGEIKEAFSKTKLTLNSFAVFEGKKHKLSPTAIKNILKSRVNT